MLCDKCKQKEATYHSTVNINGNVTATHLCSACAIDENKVNKMFNVGNFLGASFFDIDNELITKKPIKNQTSASVCTVCGKTFDNFLETGLLGCSHCYTYFLENLLPIIKTMQPEIKHVGKTLLENEELEGNELTLKNLEFKLKQAVANENYELASELKKKINDMKNGGN